ncbi:Intermembrane transport protein PqiA-like [Trypanosoma melophagium]|uniref:Intermembrane transport protein PqiA-like n=1 Tax=Trypanosoma melophagium TaxID=715481 RepID=UPI00351A8D34|nr:Intermembrane transport protein PqiA-like [Trypanosoma melophagium]
MISTCLWIFFFWSSLFTEVKLPDFSFDFGIATVSNLTCQNVQIGTTSGTFNSSLWFLMVKETSNISCSVDFEMGVLRSRIYSTIKVNPSEISMTKTCDDDCYSTTLVKDQCTINLMVDDLHLDSPNPLMDMILPATKKFIENEVDVYVCKVILPLLMENVKNQTLDKPTSFPDLVNGATPLEDAPLFRAGVKILNEFPEIHGMQLNASIHAGTTVQLGFTFPKGFQMSLGEVTKHPPGMLTLLYNSMQGFLPDIFSLNSNTQYDFMHNSFINNSVAEVEVEHPFFASLDISFNNLHCKDDGFVCTLPCTDAVTLQNLRLKNLGEWDAIVVNHLGPLAVSFINKFINATTFSLCNNSKSDHLLIPSKKPPPVIQVPPLTYCIGFAVFAIVIIVGSVYLSLWKYRFSPASLYDGTVISLRRTLTEDIIIVLMALTTAFGFFWSNTTTAATLLMGGDVGLLSFSLMETTRSLYEAGLKPLAVLVFLFSGVYPYIKLLCILVCTVILQKPDLMILRVVDYLGKCSFLDSYAMVIMASGLQISGIADVDILPGFYVFLASTILSILTGNYATIFWRRKTSLRRRISSPDLNHLLDDEYSLQYDHNEDSIDSGKSIYGVNMKSFCFSVMNGIFVLICTLPAWIFPSMRYKVTGMASILQSSDRDMTLFELSSTSYMLLVTCIFTIAVAPFLYALMYPRWPFFASWCAADVLLLACVAGLLQLGQFVEFVIGKNMNSVYRAEAELLWPLLFLLIASVWQWILAAVHVLGIWKGIAEKLAERKRTVVQTEAEM